MALRDGPTKYSASPAQQLKKIGETGGIPKYADQGQKAVKVTETQGYLGSLGFWESAINDVGNNGVTGASADGGWIIFAGGDNLMKGSITTEKTIPEGPFYTPPDEIVNVVDNDDIVLYTLSGKAILSTWKGKTETRTYSSTTAPSKSAGTREGNNLITSVSVGDYKYIDDKLWRTITITKVIYKVG